MIRGDRRCFGAHPCLHSDCAIPQVADDGSVPQTALEKLTYDGVTPMPQAHEELAKARAAELQAKR